MNRLFLFIIGSFLCLSLSSCFDIVEEISLKSNGSGSIKGTLNLSKSRTKVSSLMKLDKIDGINVPSQNEIRKEMNTLVSLLKNTKGISNVSSKLDFNNFIASISCDFNNVEALNAYTNTLSKHFKTKINSYSSYSYDSNNKVLTRSYTHSNDAKKEFQKLRTENQKSFNDAYYTCIYRFEDLVKSQNHNQAKLSANKKAVMLKVDVPNLVNGKANLSNKISLN